MLLPSRAGGRGGRAGQSAASTPHVVAADAEPTARAESRGRLTRDSRRGHCAAPHGRARPRFRPSPRSASASTGLPWPGPLWVISASERKPARGAARAYVPTRMLGGLGS